MRSINYQVIRAYFRMKISRIVIPSPARNLLVNQTKSRFLSLRLRNDSTRYGAQARAVLEALLQKYQDEGVTSLDDPRILRLAPFDVMGTPVELLKTFGRRDGFEKAVRELQAALYRSAARPGHLTAIQL
jgi:type I site-specific restriction endonuclease